MTFGQVWINGGQMKRPGLETNYLPSLILFLFQFGTDTPPKKLCSDKMGFEYV